MSLVAGTRLGPYEIQSIIGEGGMGQVFKARDTRLDRSVAIKVLPPDVSADPDRRARFEREARTVAGLSHPHICALYDVGETDGTTYLVMEHLLGQTLADRLTKGPLPLDQALTVTTEIADALTAAHRQGVIHRDLKPGNVMLTKTGGVRQGSPQAKLLDFGLAKLTGHGEQAAAASLASAPTQTRPLTSEGAIVGTLQYMAPEQVEGKPADARTDLWALGAILYEMLTGKRAFSGDSAASLIGNIMNAEPAAIGTLQPLTPPSVDRLVRKCLAKAPDDRWDSAHDLADELRWLREISSAGVVAGAESRRRRSVPLVIVSVAALLLIATGVALTWLLRTRTDLAGLALQVGPADEVNAGGFGASYPSTPGGSRTALTWTPDGKELVFIGRRRDGIQQVYVRSLDSGEARPLKGTQGGQVPAVSPDGQWVAFWAPSAIKKVPLKGGTVQDVVPDTRQPPAGLTWDERGGIFYSRVQDARIWYKSSDGPPEPITTKDESHGLKAHLLPALLPGGRVLLYTARGSSFSWSGDRVMAKPLPTGRPKSLLADAADARYVSSGHLVFMRRGKLFAVAFDPGLLQVKGTETAVLDEVAQALTGGHAFDLTGAGQFAVSPNGVLAWLPGREAQFQQYRLVSVDRAGFSTPLPAPTLAYSGLAVSPDERHVAAAERDMMGSRLLMLDLSRPGPPRPIYAGMDILSPMFIRDGREVVFESWDGSRRRVFVQATDGTTKPRLLDWAGNEWWGSSIARDGRIVAVVDDVEGRDIAIVRIESDKVLVEEQDKTTNAAEAWPAFSPDGRWLAYGSNTADNTRYEIYVRACPRDGAAPFSVSVDGGECPAWNPKRGELFYLTPLQSGRRRMMSVSIGPGSLPGRPVELFNFDASEFAMSGIPIRGYDVSRDGQKFYTRQRVAAADTPRATHINLTRDWLRELKEKAPAKR